MSADKDHQLSPLIRIIESPSDFSIKAHGPGYVIFYDTRSKSIGQPTGFLERLVGGRDRFIQYFVKETGKPFNLEGWGFQWKNVANDMELDFAGNFSLEIVGKSAAEHLVAALSGSKNPGIALQALIEKKLTGLIDQQLQNIASGVGNAGKNLLDMLSDADHESRLKPVFEQQLSAGIAQQLGQIPFLIGFKFRNLPSRHLEIEKHPTAFTLPDVAGEREVFTSVRLELTNYQNYRRSGLLGSEAAEARVKQFIDDAIRKFIFSKPYYDIASEFQNKIKPDIKSFIAEQARKIGYDIEIFQTQPNIDALCLADGFRVDLLSSDHEFRPKHSTGYVRIDVSIELTARDYRKVAQLISPGKKTSEIRATLITELAQICRDQIHQIDRKQFNLAFDQLFDTSIASDGTVREKLESALKRVFDERYGLTVSVINISQAQTEEGERFTNIRGKATPFHLNISSQADGGKRENVEIDGVFEVVDIDPYGWDKFESKDFGYRKQSIRWTPARLAELTAELQGKYSLSFSPEDFEKERKAVAVREELAEIGARVVSLLENAFSKIPEIAIRSREWKQIQSLTNTAEELVKRSIKDEFGLYITLREFRRLDTLTERTQSSLLAMQNDAHLERAKKGVANSDALADASHDAKMLSLNELKLRKVDQLSDIDDLEEINAQMEGLVGDNDWDPLSSTSIRSVLEHEPSKDSRKLLLGQELGILPDQPSPDNARLE